MNEQTHSKSNSNCSISYGCVRIFVTIWINQWHNVYFKVIKQLFRDNISASIFTNQLKMNIFKNMVLNNFQNKMYSINYPYT